MLMRRLAGTIYIVTALVTGYWGLVAMFTPSGGGGMFWWPLTMFGAPILLLVGGILTFFPQAKKGWLVGLVGAILFATWATLIRDFSLTYWIFAVGLVFVKLGVLVLASALTRTEVVALIATLALTASWLPGSVNAARAYFFPNPPSVNPPVMFPLLAFWALIITASVLSGIAFFRSSRA